MKKLIAEDLFRVSGREYTFTSLLYWCLKTPGLHFLVWVRVYQGSNLRIIKFLSNFIISILKIVYGFQFSPKLKIGRGFYIGHWGHIVINVDTKFGNNCNIGPGIIIGTNHGKDSGAPQFGDEVWIGSNSVIVGPVVIDSNVVIAPGAYVNFNVPSNSVVLGNPGKIIPKDDPTKFMISRKV